MKAFSLHERLHPWLCVWGGIGPCLQTAHDATHTGGGRVQLGGSSERPQLLRANQIQWRQRQSRLPARPPASPPACLLFLEAETCWWQLSSLHRYRSQLVIGIFITATAVCSSVKLQLNNQMIFSVPGWGLKVSFFPLASDFSARSLCLSYWMSFALWKTAPLICFW